MESPAAIAQELAEVVHVQAESFKEQKKAVVIRPVTIPDVGTLVWSVDAEGAVQGWQMKFNNTAEQPYDSALIVNHTIVPNMLKAQSFDTGSESGLVLESKVLLELKNFDVKHHGQAPQKEIKAVLKMTRNKDSGAVVFVAVPAFHGDRVVVSTRLQRGWNEDAHGH